MLLISTCLFFLGMLAGCAPSTKAIKETELVQEPSPELALEYYVLGNNYYYKGLLEPAFRAYGQALIHEPDKAKLRGLVIARALEAGRADLAANVAEAIVPKERTAKEWRLLGEAYLRSGRLDDAEASLKRALPQLQDDPGVHFTLGIIYEARKKMPLAIEEFRLAARLSGGSLETEEKSALRYLQIGNSDSARTILERLAAQHPSESRFMRSLAMVEEAKGNDSGAIAVYRRIVTADSNDEAALSSLGNLYFRNENWKEAQQCYRRLYTGDSTALPVGRALAYTFIELGQLDSAERLLKNLLSKNADEADLYYYLGILYNEKASAALGKTPKDTISADNAYESALIELNKAVAIRRDFQEAHIQLGFVHLNKKSYSEALRVFAESSQQWPNAGRIHFYKALAQRALGQKDKAAASLSQAVKLEPKNIGALFELGSLYEQTGESEKSERIFEQLLRLDPKHALSLNYLGYMWAERGVKLTEARGLIERALAIEPKNAAFLDSYGWVLFKLGDLVQAEKYLQKAIAETQAPDPVMLDHLGDVYHALKDKTRAQDYWKKALALDPKSDALQKKVGGNAP